MIIKNERLYYPKGVADNNIYMFTANSVVKEDGCLVMGRGSALQVKNTYRGVDKMFGEAIDNKSVFGVKFIKHPLQHVGAFQTKIDWREQSPIEVVEYSVKFLKFIADNKPHHTFHLPCPAVGCGGKDIDEVLPLLSSLPDNVIIYVE